MFIDIQIANLFYIENPPGCAVLMRGVAGLVDVKLQNISLIPAHSDP